MENLSLPPMFNQVLLSLTAMVIMAYYGLGVWKEHIREQPIPSETYAKEVDCKARHSVGYALESDCRSRTAEVRNDLVILRAHFDQARDKEDSAATDRRKAIYDMIRQTETNLRGEMTSMRQEHRVDLQGVHRRIDEVLGAVRELKGKVEA